MQEFVKTCGFIILSLVVLVIIKGIKADIQIPIKLVVAIVLFGVVITGVSEVIGGFNDIITTSGASKYVTVMLKSLFVGIITSICSTLCQDAGEGTLSFICVLVGKVQILLLALPLIYEILDMTIKLVGGD